MQGVIYKLLSLEKDDLELIVTYNVEPRGVRWAKPINSRPLQVRVVSPWTTERIASAVRAGADLTLSDDLANLDDVRAAVEAALNVEDFA